MEPASPWIPASFLLQWHLTERCDRRCRHCYQENTPGGELDWPHLMALLEQFKALLGQWRQGGRPLPAQITVTGGEPYLRADFPRFLEHLAREREHFAFALLCHGGHIDPATARHLASLRPRFVQVSVDGRPDRHDQLRGVGDFARVERAVITLKEAGLRTLVAFTAHPGNAEDFPWVARWAWRRRVDRLWADRLIPWGTAAGGELGLLTPPQTRRFVTTLARARQAWWRRLLPRGEVATHRALQFLAGHGRPYRCTAGDRLLALRPDGTLLPCRRLPIPLGQALTPGGLARIYQHHPLLRQLRQPGLLPEGCRGCLYGPLCRGGLRCLAHAVTGDPFRRDPGCWLEGHGTTTMTTPSPVIS